MEYWQYGGDSEQSPMLSMASSHPALRTRDAKEEARLLANTSTPISYRPPFALHTEDEFNHQDLRARGGMRGRDAAAAALAVLEKRAFVCPTGTSDCSTIGYPNSCCATDETCFAIQDTGLGPVGCCPNGSSCGGTITNCDVPNTACPDSLGGGCCIPNYVCAGVGCKLLNSFSDIWHSNISCRCHEFNYHSSHYLDIYCCPILLDPDSCHYHHTHNHNDELIHRSTNHACLLNRFSRLPRKPWRRMLWKRLRMRLLLLLSSSLLTEYHAY